MGRAAIVGAGAAVLITVAAAAAAAGGYALTAAARGPAPTRSAAATPSAVAAAGRSPGAMPGPGAGPPLRPSAVGRALGPGLRAGALGGDLRAQVLNLSTGTVLYGARSATPVAPASTAKLLTAAALLAVRSPADRLTTTVRSAPGGVLVLVGGGDPTLSAAPAGRPTRYPHAARISDLAAQVRRAGVRVRRVVVDDTRFAGASVSPYWAAEDVPSDYGSAITAAMADGGRATPDATERSASPDLDAGHALAAALGTPDLPVTRGRAPAGARTVAGVRSAQLSDLIEQMLHNSDNVIAECLGRQVALADHRSASFAGAAAGIRDVLRQRTGIDSGAGMVDASGLAAHDRLAPATLTAVLRAATSQPRLRDVVTGMAVGGWSGTLGSRFLSGSARSAAGLVRAKTGTLTGVSALAGLVHSRSGALLAFDLVTARAGDTATAEADLDALVGRLAACGC